MISPAIAGSLAAGGAIVALETAVFTHGLPRDAAVPCVREIRTSVKAEGADPAICGVVEGRPTIGMSDLEIECLLTAEGEKTSPATLPRVVGLRQWAGTTAGATMILAHHVGITCVATGGIGGVHPGAGHDVSGDLTCLGRLPLIVICSGAKAILDLDATMEVLETLGVTVVGYRTDELPGFYTCTTGRRLPGRVESPHEIMAVWRAARSVGSPASLVVMNPPPAHLAFDAPAVEAAVRRARQTPCAGPSATPTLLRLVQEDLGPRSVQLNQALLVANARLAAQVGIVISREGYSR
jgi:pseudouridine-5'-phosphate glycosidase